MGFFFGTFLWEVLVWDPCPCGLTRKIYCSSHESGGADQTAGDHNGGGRGRVDDYVSPGAYADYLRPAQTTYTEGS